MSSVLRKELVTKVVKALAEEVPNESQIKRQDPQLQNYFNMTLEECKEITRDERLQLKFRPLKTLQF